MKISDSEMEIMKIIWDMDREVTTADLGARLGKVWKPTTVLTFLKRLVDKGVLTVSRVGKTNYYRAVISEAEYKSQQTEEFLEEFHSGSVKNFLAALYGGKKPKTEEIEEIKQWFEEI